MLLSLIFNLTFRFFKQGPRRPRVLFKRKYRKIRRGRPVYRVRVGKRFILLRKIGRRMRIKFLRKWRRLQNRGSVWKVYVGRRWHRIRRKGRRWYLRYKNRLRPLRRNSRTFQIRLLKGYRALRRVGKRFWVKLAKRFRPMRRRFTWFTKYKGRRVLVKRKGRLGFVRWRGRWFRGRRLRYRRRTRRGTDINSEYSFLSSMIMYSSY